MNPIVRWSLTLVAVAGLAVDAYTHYDLASQYKFNKTSTISEGTLFKIEATLAIVVGLALILRADRLVSAAVFLVAAGGAGLLVLYRYVNVGKIGPLPNMYDPLWFPEKNWSIAGEIVAALAALALLFAPRKSKAGF
jgi:hypothetical protein